jgi:hypothetical protein
MYMENFSSVKFNSLYVLCFTLGSLESARHDRGASRMATTRGLLRGVFCGRDRIGLRVPEHAN